MRYWCASAVLIGSMNIAASMALGAPFTTGVTYQGQLKQEGVPASGTFPMTFELFDSLTAGVLVGGPLVLPAVSVSNGVFQVELDFGSAVFEGSERFLQVTVNGLPLSPRQRIAPAPYALHALNAGDRHSLDAADGLPADAVFVDANGQMGIGTATPLAALDVVDATGLALRINDDVFVDSSNGFVGIGRSNRLTTAEVFGLRRTGTGYGGMYVEVSDAAGMPFYGYATNGNGRAFHYLDSAAGWRLFMGSADRLTVSASGDMGIATITPEGRLHVFKGSAGTVTADANSFAVFENNTNGYLSLLTPDSSERGVLFGEPSSNVSGGIIYNSTATPDGLQFRTNGNNVHMVIDAQGEVGIGTTAPVAPLDMALGDKRFQVRNDGGLVPGINLSGTGGNLGILRLRNRLEIMQNDAATAPGSLSLTNTSGAAQINLDGGAGNIDANGAIRVDGANTNVGSTTGGVLRFGGGNSGEVIASKRSATGNQYGLDFYTGHANRMVITNGGSVGIGTTSPQSILDVNGRTRTDSLEIVGGADLAEPFDVQEINAEPGSVVVIDPEHPGALAVSTQPYDRKVAGIISGAKGLAPGMVLRSKDRDDADGAHLVAMTGRVWCKCDASFGSIKAGDLLTTSATVGHAMRVSDDATVPRGAILGKAMSELSDGQGLVLVLVNLQ